MSDDQLPRDADFDELNSTLNEGLKTCRSMVANYRSLLAPDPLIVEMAANDTEDEALETGSVAE